MKTVSFFALSKFKVYRDLVTSKVFCVPIPQWLKPSRVLYDPSFKAQVLELHIGQMLPDARLCNLFAQDGIALSQGSIRNFVLEGAAKLCSAGFPVFMQRQLPASDALYSDETGSSRGKDTACIHSCGNGMFNCFHFSLTRGRTAHEEMDILPHYKGVPASDCFVACDGYDDKRALCHAQSIESCMAPWNETAYTGRSISKPFSNEPGKGLRLKGRSTTWSTGCNGLCTRGDSHGHGTRWH